MTSICSSSCCRLAGTRARPHAGQQREAAQALRRGLIKYDHDHGYRGPDAQIPDVLITQIDQHFSSSAQSISPDSASATATATTEEAPLGRNTSLGEELTRELQQRLDELDSYEEQIPGVVLRVQDQSALVLASDLGLGELQLADSRWARTYISVDERGPSVRQMSDIVQVGDIVRVNPSGSEN